MRGKSYVCNVRNCLMLLEFHHFPAHAADEHQLQRIMNVTGSTTIFICRRSLLSQKEGPNGKKYVRHFCNGEALYRRMFIKVITTAWLKLHNLDEKGLQNPWSS